MVLEVILRNNCSENFSKKKPTADLFFSHFAVCVGIAAGVIYVKSTFIPKRSHWRTKENLHIIFCISNAATHRCAKTFPV